MDREKQGGKDMRDAPASAEQKTVKRAMRGTVEAYGVLIREQKEYLYRTAYLYSGNEEDALEIVQETVLRAFRSIRNLKDPAVFRTWITRILINVSKDYYNGNSAMRRRPDCGFRRRRKEFPPRKGWISTAPLAVFRKSTERLSY